ncbi:short transient receptor potential channel 4-like [Antedon mediterranea]|uniref:short transient receptor potential channel 4-like n=1 Tax=Antedon mediterranea TaxID=105859 RepID=UPI003AF4B190
MRDLIVSKQNTCVPLSKSYTGNRLFSQTAIIVKVLLRFRVKIGDALLYAVENNAVEVVKMICSYAITLPQKNCQEIIDCRCSTDEFPKISTPIIQAALKNNFTIVKILLEYGVRIPDPKKDLEHFTAPPETLERSKEMLIVYQALASDAYITGSSINPLQAAFDLTNELRGLSEKLEEFRDEFNDLAHQVEAYAGKLLDQTRDTEEILTVLTFTDGQNTEPEISHLAMVDYALDCSQKNFVAHPNCQKVVINQYFRHLIPLRDASTMIQMLTQILVMIGFPFLSIAFLVYPSKYIVRFLQVPYVKFFMSIGSEIVFLALLLYDTVSDIREGAPYIATQILISIWILGKTWAEIQRMINDYETFFGSDLMTSIYNYLLLVLLFSVFMLRFVVYLQDLDRSSSTSQMQKRALDDAMLQESQFLTNSIPSLKSHILVSLNETEGDVNANLDESLDVFLADLLGKLTCKTPEQTTPEQCAESDTRLSLDSYNPVLVTEAMYSFAIVLAFLRLSSIAVINEFVGPLQISLSGMVKDIAVFGGIFFVVWLAFSIGMNQLHNTFQAIEYDQCIRAMTEDCHRGPFSSVRASLETFYWALFGNIGFGSSFIGNGDFLFSELVSIIFFAIYIVAAVIILLNALIAMMSSTYCTVEENADIEWKFSRTATWMTFMNPSVSLPPPFNLIPCAWNICKKEDTEHDTQGLKDENYFKRKYQKVVGKLVERFAHEVTAEETSTGGGVSKRDIQSIKSDIMAFRYECNNMLNFLNKEMEGTTRQTLLTRDKLEITKDIKSKAEDIRNRVAEHKQGFTELHADLTEIHKEIQQSERTKPPPKQQPLKRTTSSRVSMMSSFFDTADETGGNLTEEAKDLFK